MKNRILKHVIVVFCLSLITMMSFITESFASMTEPASTRMTNNKLPNNVIALKNPNYSYQSTTSNISSSANGTGNIHYLTPEWLNTNWYGGKGYIFNTGNSTEKSVSIVTNYPKYLKYDNDYYDITVTISKIYSRSTNQKVGIGINADSPGVTVNSVIGDDYKRATVLLTIKITNSSTGANFDATSHIIYFGMRDIDGQEVWRIYGSPSLNDFYHPMNLTDRTNVYYDLNADSIDFSGGSDSSDSDYNALYYKMKSSSLSARYGALNNGNWTTSLEFYEENILKASKNYASNTPSGAGGGTVKAGDEIKYQIYYQYASGTVTITDTLSKGLSYVSGSSSLGEPTITNNSDGTTKLVWTTTNTSATLTYSAKVANNVCDLGINQVKNSAEVKDSTKTLVLTELKNPVVSKCYASDSEDGKNSASVAVGDKIKYAIRYANTKTSSTTATITDTLSKGLTYVSGSAKVGSTVVNPTITNNSDGTTTLTWTRTLAAGATEELKYEAEVKSAASGIKVCNNASVTIGNKVTLSSLCNPVPTKTYGGSSLSNNAGWNHHEVKVGDDIKYSIKIPNVKNVAQTVVVTDALSKGLTYNNDAVVSGGTLSNQTSSGSGPTTVTLTISVPAGGTATLTYSGKVNSSAVSIVKNNAKAKYGSEPELSIGTLSNPILTKEYASDSPSGTGGNAVKVGDVIKYSISYANVANSAQTVTITDTLSKGLQYVSGSSNFGNPTITNNSDGTTKLVWTRSVNAGVGEQLTYSAKVTSAALTINTVNNSASIKIGNNSEVTLIPLQNPVPVKTYASDTQSGKDGAVVQKDDVIKYSIKYTNPSSESRTVRIVDTLSKGLSYVANSGKVNNTTVSVSTTTNSAGQTIITMTKSIAAGATEEFTYSAKVTGETTIVNNNATIKYDSLPEISLDELKNPIPAKTYASDTPSGKNNSAVSIGSIIKYSIKYANASLSSSTITIKDTISKGLDFVSGSAKMGSTSVTPTVTNNSDGSTTLTFSKSVNSGVSEELTYSVKVNGEETIVKNNASIKYGNNPEVFLNELKNPVPSKEYSSSTTAGANNQEVKNGDKIKYSIKYANTTTSSKTVTIKDTISKGLEYVSGSAKVGSTSLTPAITNNSDGTTTLVWTKSIAAGATETLEYEAKVTGASTLVQNGATIKYGNDSEIILDELKNAVPTKEYNPDTPSGLNGDVVKKGDTINYVIKYANAYSTNQTVTITDTISKGLEYVSGSAKIGSTSVTPVITNNSDGSTKMVCTKLVNSGTVEELKYSVKVTGEKVVVQNSANVKFGNNPLVDLNKLKNPVPTKTYASDTPSGAGGVAVAKEDIIKYNISYANIFNHDETVVITDVISKGLSYVSGSAKVGSTSLTPVITNNSDGTTKLVFTRTVSANTEESLTYSVKVDGGVQEVQNNAKIKYNSTGTEIKLDELKNPLPSKEYASDTPNGKNGEAVKKGEIIKYSIKYGNKSGVNSTITITDTLSKGLEYVSGSAKIGTTVINPNVVTNSNGTTVLTWTKTLNANTSEELVYSARTTGETTIVNNQASIKYGNDPQISLGTLQNSVPSKDYASDSPNGKDNKAVKIGEQIKYSIKYANTTSSSTSVTITDIVSKGLEFVNGSAKIGGVSITPVKTANADGTTKLVFTKSVAANTSEELIYSVKVNGEVTTVNNNASIKYGNNPEIELNVLKNPIPDKMYASDTPSGKNGAEVSEGEKIKYAIKYSNVKSGADSVVISDTLSVGLEYVEGSAKIGNSSITPTVVKNSDKTTTLTWSKSLAGNTTEELTYEVLVLGDVSKVENAASIKYNSDPEIELTKLINPLVVSTEVPNVGTQISIIEIITGLALVAFGGYTIYRRKNTRKVI